jgi:protein SCO1/2
MVNKRLLQFLAACIAGLLLCASPAHAAPVSPSELIDRTDPLPKRLEGIDVKERLDTALPLMLNFKDESDKPVVLKQYFDGKVPVILTFNYSNCPMLCSLQLNAVVEGLKKVAWTAGQQFRIVTIVLDPEENADTTRKTKARYLAQYGRPEAKDGWHFLRGSEANVRALATGAGISYAYNEKREEYVHPAAIVLATPNGKVARYLYGLEYTERTLRLGLVESSEGKIGTTVDRLILFCFHYDADEGRYAPYARNIMRLSGGLTVFALAGFLTVLWRRENKRRPEGTEQ